MVDLEVVAVPDTAKHRTQDRLVDVLDTLAVRADQVMVVLGHARDVRGHVAWPLQPRCHPGFDLGFEGAVDGREAEARVGAMESLVELLRGDGLPFGGEHLRDDHPLFRQPPAA